MAPSQSSQTHKPQSSPNSRNSTTHAHGYPPLRSVLVAQVACCGTMRVMHDSFARRVRSLPASVLPFCCILWFPPKPWLSRSSPGWYVTHIKTFAWVRLLTAERSSGPPLLFALACSIAGQFGGLPFGSFGVSSVRLSILAPPLSCPWCMALKGGPSFNRRPSRRLGVLGLAEHWTQERAGVPRLTKARGGACFSFRGSPGIPTVSCWCCLCRSALKHVESAGTFCSSLRPGLMSLMSEC